MFSAKIEPSQQQKAILDSVKNNSGDLLVEALAGTGKTTSLVMISQQIKSRNVLFLAFNKSIAEELAERLPPSVRVRTAHSYGKSVLTANFSDVKWIVRGNKYNKVITSEVKNLSREMSWEIALSALKKLVTVTRANLIDPMNLDAMKELFEHFKIEGTKKLKELSYSTARILTWGEQEAQFSGLIDFEDMIWLPLQWNLNFSKYAWILADECQDLTKAQQEMIFRSRGAGGRLVFVGDKKQAIYGFRGADHKSFDNIAIATKAHVLPLTTCYRCPSTVITEAKKLVPEISAAPWADVGSVRHELEENLPNLKKEGDLILCRLKAPLISWCCKLIAQNVPARVKGRDIGKQLIDKVREAFRIGYEENCLLDNYFETMRQSLETRQVQLQNAGCDDDMIEALNDEFAAINSIYSAHRPQDFLTFETSIQELFDDNRASVWLSTIHKAKGLEADRILILSPKKLPLTWAKQKNWEKVQELNLKYVAVTRAKQELIWLHEDIRSLNRSLDLPLRDFQTSGGDKRATKVAV